MPKSCSHNGKGSIGRVTGTSTPHDHRHLQVRLIYHSRNTRKVGEVANAPVAIVHIKDESYSYYLGVYANDSDSSVNAVKYKSTSDRLGQIEECEAVKKKNEQALKTNWP